MNDASRRIEESKRRCAEVYQLDPTVVPELKVEISEEELQKREHSLEDSLPVIRHFMEKVIHYMDGTPTHILTTDHEGYVMDSFGEASIMKMVEAFGLVNGVQFNEEIAGTNAISLAIQHQEPFAMVGGDHYHDALQGVACYTVPFSYSEDEELTGTVSIMTMIDYASQFHLGLLSSAVDSIERELRLQEKNNRLEILNQVMIGSTPIGIVITDRYGNIVEFNKALRGIVEYDLQAEIDSGNRKTNVIKPYVDEALQTGNRTENVQVHIPVENGSRTKTCLVDVLPLYEEGTIIGTFSQVRDMTDYYELQKQLIESEKLSTLGRFSAGLAHEIRNPLTSIIGLTQLLRESNAENKYLDIIVSELERMKSLVNQFMQLGKPARVNPVWADLYALVEHTGELMKSNTELRDVRLVLTAENSDFHVMMDQAQMKQVMINFIKNAFEAMPNGGNVYVHLGKNEETNQAVITIQDEGQGMSPEQVEKIGTPFFTSKESGLGMGLPICFDIIKAHNGDVHVESELGEGTKVKVGLPL